MINAKYVVITVIGEHADELVNAIFERKIRDIENIGITFWLLKSRNAKPIMVQKLCKVVKSINEDVFVIFIKPATSGGATPTETAERATSYSTDNTSWINFPEGISLVTGKIDRGAFALAFSQIRLIKDSIDLRFYANFFDQDQPLKIIQGASTICALEKVMINHPNAMKSYNREVVAIGKLCEPYCVYLR